MSSDIASVEIERLRKRVDDLEYILTILLKNVLATHANNRTSKRPVASLRKVKRPSRGSGT